MTVFHVFVRRGTKAGSLDLVKGVDIHGLDMVLKAEDMLLKDVSADLVILNYTRDTELLNPIADGNQLGGSPKQAVKADATDLGLQLGHVGLIVPGLDVQDDGGLGNDGGLLGLLGLVLSKAGSLGGFSLGVLLLVRAEELKVVIGGGLLGNDSGAVLGGSLFGAREAI